MPEELAGPVPGDAHQAAGVRPADGRRPGARDPRPRARAALGQHQARRVRRRAGGVGLDRPGAQGGLARRARGRREDPVPRGGRGPDVRPQPALPGRPDGRVVAARHRRQADHGRAQGADERGARLPPRGPPPAALRRPPSATTTTCSCPTCSSTPTTCSSPSGSTAPRCRGSSPRAPRRSATRPPRSTSSSCCGPRTGPGCCTPTRTRATSGSPTTAGSACSTSAPSTGSPTGCRRPWAGCSPRRSPVRREALEAGLRDEGFIRKGVDIDPEAAARLPHPARRAAARGGVHLLARVAARRRRPDPGPAAPAVPRRAQAQPAAGVPADPPGLARRHRGAQPDRRHRAAARDGLRAPARHRRVTAAAASAALTAGSPPGGVELPLDAAQVGAAAGVAGPHVAAVLDAAGPGDPRPSAAASSSAGVVPHVAHTGRGCGCRRPGIRGRRRRPRRLSPRRARPPWRPS